MRFYLNLIFACSLIFQPQVSHAKVDPSAKVDPQVIRHIQQLQGPLSAYMENRESEDTLQRVRREILRIEAFGGKTKFSPVSQLNNTQLKAKLEEVIHVAGRGDREGLSPTACLIVMLTTAICYGLIHNAVNPPAPAPAPVQIQTDNAGTR